MADERLTDKTCAEFTRLLAAKTSVPGGGGAAALTGALAVSLGSMAASFTVGKKKYAQYEEELKAAIEEADSIRLELLDLAEEDAACFEPLSRAYGIPKEDPSRAEVLEQATLSALQPPLRMMRSIAKAIVLIERLEVTSSVLMISDVACGALLAEAALKSASLNVYINTKSLRDRGKAAEAETEADAILAEYAPRAAAAAEKVTARIRG